MEIWWGTVAWSGAGLVLALVLRLLPPWRGSSWLLALAIGLAGALAGGVVATALGFGGLAAIDVRSIATAALGALLALLGLALARVPKRS
ncbi:MAG TPA: GlsB/YeaQ/YmgE family stress response membrane protein [Thermoanaerobaculia bacterium]|nr:GlsB/YeaQ/YmgE family stress response membrane protein [Thermoanaerobaculia bacterium]